MLIPPINSKGTFKVKEPYNEKVNENVVYTVTAIRSLEEINDSNENPLKHIYEANGRSIDDYNEDLLNKIPIVVLTNDSGHYIYVPADMFISIPKISGYLYKEKIIAVNLGLVHKEHNLNLLKEDIKEIVKGHLGITPGIKELDTSADVLIDKDKHNIFKQRIYGAINNYGGALLVRYKKALDTINMLNEKIEKLKCYIIDNENK